MQDQLSTIQPINYWTGTLLDDWLRQLYSIQMYTNMPNRSDFVWYNSATLSAQLPPNSPPPPLFPNTYTPTFPCSFSALARLQ